MWHLKKKIIWHFFLNRSQWLPYWFCLKPCVAYSHLADIHNVIADILKEATDSRLMQLWERKRELKPDFSLIDLIAAFGY